MAAEFEILQHCGVSRNKNTTLVITFKGYMANSTSQSNSYLLEKSPEFAPFLLYVGLLSPHTKRSDQ